MELVEVSNKELTDELNKYLSSANLQDKKWLWNYFQDHDRWPLVNDEIRPKKEVQSV